MAAHDRLWWAICGYEGQKSYGRWVSVSQVRGGEPAHWLAERVPENRTVRWFRIIQVFENQSANVGVGARALAGMVRGSFHGCVKRPGIAGAFSL
jgi:hypothetical protein